MAGSCPGPAAAGRQSAAEAVRGEPVVPRSRSAGECVWPRAGRRRWARRRVAARQLPHHRGGPPRGPPRPAHRLRRGAAQARRRPRSRAIPASTPWRLALVAHTDSELDEARIDALRPGLPGGGPADDRRALGAADDAPPGAAREPAAAGRADDLGLGRAPPRRALGGRGSGASDEAKRVAHRRRAPVLSPDLTDPFVVRLLQVLRDQGLTAAERLEPARDAARARGADANEVLRREHRRQAANQVSVGNCVHQPPPALGAWTGTPSSSTQPGRDVLRGPGRRLRAAGLRHPRPLPAGGREDRRGRTGRRARRGAAGRRAGPARAGVADDARRGTSATTWSVAAGAAGGRVPLPPGLDATGPSAWSWSSGPSTSARWPRCWPCSWRRPVALTGGRSGAGSGGVAGVVALLLPASELAVGLVNHVLDAALPPRVLPKLDFKDGIPADCATFVVMPTMLVRPRERGDAARAAGDPLPRQPRPADSASPC